jgi:hypothetical protein
MRTYAADSYELSEPYICPTVSGRIFYADKEYLLGRRSAVKAVQGRTIDGETQNGKSKKVTIINS